MKNSVKLKINDFLLNLIENPEELAILIKLAILKDEEGVSDIETKGIEEQLENLVFWGFVKKQGNKYLIKDKKIVDVTLSRKTSKQQKINKTLLKDIDVNNFEGAEKENIRITLMFWSLFRKNLKEKGMRTMVVDLAYYKTWVNAVRLMRDVDEVTLMQLREVYDFLGTNDFWKVNVQSTPKLREKFETIHRQALNEINKQHAKTIEDGTKQSGVSDDYASKLLRKIQG